MNKKLMIAVLALLGFATACSSVKTAPKTDSKGEKEIIRPIVMYGVRLPQQQVDQELSDTLKATEATKVDLEQKTEAQK
ncbi:MAG: hypothetical protein RSB29_06645 [Alistipes sp.]